MKGLKRSRDVADDEDAFIGFDDMDEGGVDVEPTIDKRAKLEV
jgi:hypothetical protein